MDIEKKVIDTLKKIKLNKRQKVKSLASSPKFSQTNEKIVVALSGGKDSCVVAYLLKKFGYNIEGFHIDLKIGGYSERCLKAVQELCEQLGIKCYYYDIKKEMGSSMCYLRSGIQSRAKGTIKNCAICGVIKKWIINKKVRELKADKIATGHNLDDEAQTFLMNIFKGSPQLSGNLGVITRNISDKKFIPRIKPLFYVPENEIRNYAKKMKLPVVYEKCPCAIDSYRIQVRSFLENLPDKEKENIVKNFDELFPRIKKAQKDLINYCEVCEEPCRGKICKKCGLMGA